MNMPCTKATPSPVMPGRCGNCGWPLTTHQADERLKTPREIAERLSETFDPGGSIDYDIDDWATEHATAIDEARAVLEDPLTGDISNAALDVLSMHPSLVRGSINAWPEMLDHQVRELRSLIDAPDDVESPILQARQRLVKVAGIATAFAELLDRHQAKAASPFQVSNDLAEIQEPDPAEAADPPKGNPARKTTKRRSQCK